MATKPIVKVYSTPTCPYCVMVKDFLKQNKVAFEDINVADDEEAANEMVEKSGQMGVPVIIVGKEVVIGCDKSRLKELLKLK